VNKNWVHPSTEQQYWPGKSGIPSTVYIHHIRVKKGTKKWWENHLIEEVTKIWALFLTQMI
jgi:hypothetical protein